MCGWAISRWRWSKPERGPTVSYIHPDHLGRPIALTDATGAFVNETIWVAFGGIHIMSGSVGLDLRFPGQWYQHEGGLHYNWNRSYYPTIGRYTQPDPLGLVDGPSRYAYVGSDPLQKVDPSGLQALPWVSGAFGVDVSVPEPTDAAWPKWVGWGVAFAGAACIDMMTGDHSDKEYCRRQNEIDEDQCFKDYSYNSDDLRGCLLRASDNLNLCLRGFPGVATWKDKDVDGWEPPKRPKT